MQKRILVIGGGEVGAKTIERLQNKCDVTLIERDAGVTGEIDGASDLTVLVGHGTCPDTLRAADAVHQDMIIAVTDSDEVNLLACWMVRKMRDTEDARRLRDGEDPLPAALMYARVRSQSLARSVRGSEMDVDVLINPEQICVAKVIEIINYHHLIDTLSFEQGRIKLYGIKLPDTSPALNQDLVTFAQGRALTIAAMTKFRTSDTVIPASTALLEAGDDIYVCATPERFPELYRGLVASAEGRATVYVAGASKIGISLAQAIAREGFKVYLFDGDEGVMAEMEANDPEGLVSYFRDKLSDLAELRAYKPREHDVLITTSDDSEENFVCALLARQLGFKRTLVITNNERYHSVIRELGLEVVLSPRQMAVNELSQSIINTLSIASHTLSGTKDVEVREFRVTPDNPYVRRRVRDLNESAKWPRGEALIAAIMRNGEGLMPSGETEILEGDLLFIISYSRHFSSIDAVFERRRGWRLWR